MKLFLFYVVFCFYIAIPTQNQPMQIFGRTASGSSKNVEEVVFERNSHISSFSTKVHNEAFMAFTELFGSEDSRLPADIILLDAFFNKDRALLTLNLSNLNYGGTYFEYQFINILKETAREIAGIGFLTILIDNRITYLPEGTIIFEKSLF